MTFHVIQNSLQRIQKGRVWKFLLILAFLFGIAMLSPAVVDDYFFSSLQMTSFSEYADFVLHYGNGRVLGNSFALYLTRHLIIRSLVKALTVLGIGYFMTRIVDSIVGGKNENVVFFLLIATAPQIFAEAFSWTSGFCNYMPPVLCCLYLAYTFLISGRKLGWIDTIAACLIGAGGELFVEHSALINFTLVCGMLVYCTLSKRNVIPALLCWVSTLLGLLTIFLIPRLFATTTEFANYQKLNLGEFHGFLMSVVGNTIQICKEYGAAVALWTIMSIAMLGHCKRQKKGRAAAPMLVAFPIYSAAYYVLTRYFSLNPNTLIAVFNTVITLGYLAAILWTILKIEKTKLRWFSLVLFLLGVYSVLPLLIVYPIGERTLFHSYVALAMLAAVNYADVACLAGKKRIDAAGVAVVLLAIVLTATYCRIHKMDVEKRSYIEMCIRNHETEIIIPHISSEYIHPHENFMIEDACFYDEPGDITFVEVEYSTWLEKR